MQHWFLLLAVLVTGTQAAHPLRHHIEPTSASAISTATPSFDTTADLFSWNVTMGVGAAALLHCPVMNQGDHSVAWIRKKDGALLMFNTIRVTKDNVYAGSHRQATNDYILAIRNPPSTDYSGLYECQVGTDTEVKTLTIRLNVVEFESTITSNRRDNVAQEEEVVQIMCHMKIPVEITPFEKPKVRWYKDGRPLQPTARHTKSIERLSDGETVLAKLQIQNVQQKRDSGTYACLSLGVRPTRLRLKVIAKPVRGHRKPQTTSAPTVQGSTKAAQLLRSSTSASALLPSAIVIFATLLFV